MIQLPIPRGNSPDAAFQMEVVEALRQMDMPLSPTRVFRCVQASLPSAAKYVGCIAVVTDLVLGTLVYSNGTNWIRQDTGAAL